MFDAGSATQFMNPTTIGTFGGATAAIVAINATLRRLTNRNSLAVPFGLAIILSYALAAKQDSLQDTMGWFIGLVNACLLFLAVVGANETVTDVATPKPAGEGEQQGRVQKKFLQSFFD